MNSDMKVYEELQNGKVQLSIHHYLNKKPSKMRKNDQYFSYYVSSIMESCVERMLNSWMESLTSL